MRMAGAYLAQGAFRTIKKKMNYEEYGGMPLAGRERHLHHRARRQHAARDQERVPRGGRID